MILVRDVFPHILAALYTGGAVFHLLRPILGIGWREMPFFPDWILVVLAPVALVGLVAFAGEVRYRGLWERITHWAIALHIFLTILLHLQILWTGSHRILAIFPISYSYYALAYFAFFAWRSWTMKLEAAG